MCACVCHHGPNGGMRVMRQWTEWHKWTGVHETQSNWWPLSWNSFTRRWRQSAASQKAPEVGNPFTTSQIIQTREKNVTNQSVTTLSYLLILPMIINRSRTCIYSHWIIWKGWGSHCLHLSTCLSGWWLIGKKNNGCMLAPKSTCLQRLRYSNASSCRSVSLREGWQPECLAAIQKGRALTLLG